MEAHLQKTVDDLLEKLRGLEKQLADTKRMVNSLCELGGQAPMFAVVDDAPTLTTIKADTFYGQAFATAAAAYLRMRKAKNMGPATVNDIYDALKQGGYQFDAKNEDYAKRGIRNSLQKNTATFHRVPNGEFGLLEWYPEIKKKPRAAASTATSDDDSDDEDDEDGSETVADAGTLEDDLNGEPGDSDDLNVQLKMASSKAKPVSAQPAASKDAATSKPEVGKIGKIVNSKLVPDRSATKADV